VTVYPKSTFCHPLGLDKILSERQQPRRQPKGKPLDKIKLLQGQRHCKGRLQQVGGREGMMKLTLMLRRTQWKLTSDSPGNHDILDKIVDR
jgi:hypothetical protein